MHQSLLGGFCQFLCTFLLVRWYLMRVGACFSSDAAVFQFSVLRAAEVGEIWKTFQNFVWFPSFSFRGFTDNLWRLVKLNLNSDKVLRKRGKVVWGRGWKKRRLTFKLWSDRCFCWVMGGSLPVWWWRLASVWLPVLQVRWGKGKSTGAYAFKQ